MIQCYELPAAAMVAASSMDFCVFADFGPRRTVVMFVSLSIPMG